MEGRSTFLRVGLLVVIGLVLMAGAIWFFGGERLRKGLSFESYFRESVQGLEVGAPVKYRGVTLGRVTEIGLVSAEYGTAATQVQMQTYRMVFVRFVINPHKVGAGVDFDTAIAAGLRTRLASQGITGLSYIELDFADPKQYPALHVPWTPEADYVPSMPSTLLQVQDAAQEILSKLNQVDFAALASAATGLLGDLRTDVANGDVHQVLTHADALLQSLNTSVAQADLPGLSKELRQTAAALHGTLDGPQAKELLDKAATAMDRLSVAANKLPPLIAALQSTATHTGNTVADLQQALTPLLRDAQAAVANLRETTDNLRRYPAGTLLGGPPPRGTGRDMP